MTVSLEEIEKEVDNMLIGECADLTGVDLEWLSTLPPEKQQQIVKDRTRQYVTIGKIIKRGREITDLE